MRFVEVHEPKPANFHPKVEVAACYLEHEGRLLLLELAPGKEEAGFWGVPAGKIEQGETPENGARRELFEETKIHISSGFQALGSLYMRKPTIDYVYHLFKISLDKMPEVSLSTEHQSYQWASIQEIEDMQLMAGAKEALQKYRSSKKRAGASVNAYLFLKQENKVLLSLRKNTGYCDGMWSFVAGHVEDGEAATSGMIREAREEIGVTPLQLKVVHIMHRRTSRLNVDIFFDCPSWEGKIENHEPEKCERLEFFPFDSLPSNFVDYNAEALEAILRKDFYSERGWM